MALFHLVSCLPVETRPPFTDWLAQCSRLLERRQMQLCPHPGWQAMYDVGLSPREAVEDDR